MPKEVPGTREAMRHLRAADPKMGAIVDRVGPCRLHHAQRAEVFDALVHSIIYQRISGAAANTVYARFLDLYPKKDVPTPEQIVATKDTRMRGAGLSPQKVSYLKDLSQKVIDGSLGLPAVRQMSDEDVIEHLTQVKGVGRWTAEMVLIFTLGRPDVLPVDDYGLQRGLKLAYGLRKWPTAKKVEGVAKAWRPYRTFGTWYIWRSLSA